MNTLNKKPNENRVDDYRQQMMEMYRQAAPSPPLDAPEENWLDSRYPEPNIVQDTTALAAYVPATEPATDPLPYIGYLRIYTFAADGAEPISNARAIVTSPNGDSQTIYANLVTDRDGFTPTIALPTVDPALTLQPGTIQPYVAYTIQITADGFQSVEHRNVPIYGDNYVTQPVAMTPIVPGRDATNMQEFSSGGPTNL